MRGNPLHNKVLIGGLKKECICLGCCVTTEVKVSGKKRVGYLDMLVEHEGYRIAVEAELTSKRVENDIWKAMISEMDELWFLVPNKRVECAIRRKLNTLPHPEELKIYVLTLGLAIQELRNRFSFIFNPYPLQKTNNKGTHHETTLG